MATIMKRNTPTYPIPRIGVPSTATPVRVVDGQVVEVKEVHYVSHNMPPLQARGDSYDYALEGLRLAGEVQEEWDIYPDGTWRRVKQ